MSDRGRLRDMTLSDYTALTRTKLDLLALFTLWLVVLPFGEFSASQREHYVLWAARVGLSAIFGIDYLIRLHKSDDRWRFAKGHVLDALAVPVPPVRIIFSLRLLRTLFRRGHFQLFMAVALLLLIDGAILVYYFERAEPTSSIDTIGEAFWWAAVTVTTVGYGEFVPATSPGRVVATAMMLLGIVILAMVTARVSSGFTASPADTSDGSDQEDQGGSGELGELGARLDRIEHLLESLSTARSQGEEIDT